MGRQGIPGFVVDVNLDEKVRLLQAEFGKVWTVGILVFLWARIYSSNYYLEWTEEVEMLFADDISVDRHLVKDFIHKAIKRGVFSQELFEKYHILTSKRIQQNFFSYVERRKKIDIVKEFLLTSEILKNKNVCINGEYVNKSQENVNILPENVCKNQTTISYHTTSKDKSIDKASSNHFLTEILIANGYVDHDSPDLQRFDNLFNETLKTSVMKDCLKVVKYFVGQKRKFGAVDNPFAYFRTSFEKGLANLLIPREPIKDFVGEALKNFRGPAVKTAEETEDEEET